MQVLLQRNIFQEFEYGKFADNLKKQAITQEVNVIPFVGEIDEPVTIKPDYCFGSTRFIDVCRERGFPVFKSFGPIEPIYSGYYLNDEGWDCKLGEIDFRGHRQVFVKPYKEKFFTGTVINPIDLFDKIQLCFSEGEDEKEQIVRVSPEVVLIGEARFFIMDGQVITGSMYRCMGEPYRAQLDQTDDAWRFAQRVVNKHGAADEAFVMDVGWDFPFGVKPMGYKIVELNNFNSSGFYKADLVSIIGHLESRKKQKRVDKRNFI